MKKYSQLISALILTAALVLPLSNVLAKHGPEPAIPEQSGVYDDPSHPGLKIKVFAHPKLDKDKTRTDTPATGTSNALVCNLSDTDSSATVAPTGWKLDPNVTYRLNTSSTPSSVGSSNLATIVANGFADWSSASGGKVIFTRGANTSVNKSRYDGQNVIAWNRLSGSSLGITYTRYYPDTGKVVDTDTIMNTRFAWAWSNSSTCANSSKYDAENIMTHELGHWMGLTDHYDAASYSNATMYGYGSLGEVKKNTLTTGDKAGVFAIYNP